MDATTGRLEAGDAAPAFALPDQHGRTVSLGDFADRRLVLYFYPEAMTPACTGQACDFRDRFDAFEAAGLAVIGVSRDSIDRLARFAEEERIDFPLLSDPDRAVHLAYRVWGEKQLYGRTVTGVIRSTFVIGADARLEQALYNVRAKGHVDSLRKRLAL